MQDDLNHKAIVEILLRHESALNLLAKKCLDALLEENTTFSRALHRGKIAHAYRVYSTRAANNRARGTPLQGMESTVASLASLVTQGEGDMVHGDYLIVAKNACFEVMTDESITRLIGIIAEDTDRGHLWFGNRPLPDQ